MITDPSTTAIYDQLKAHADADLTWITGFLAEGDAQHGEAQNGANLVRYLTANYQPAYLVALVVTAARRIRELEQEARTS